MPYAADSLPRASVRSLSVAVVLFATAIGCQIPPRPGGGTSPGGGSGPDLPPLEPLTCPDRAIAGWSAVGETGLDDHVWDLAAADEKFSDRACPLRLR